MLAAMSTPTPALTFPAGNDWPRTTPGPAGLAAASLADAFAYARAAASRQVVVLHAGCLLAEQYDGAGADDVFDTTAVQKAVVSWLVGIAQHRGLLRLDEPLSALIGAGWSRAPRAIEDAVCVRHVLTMTTGLNDALEPAGRTGVTWHYNNVVYNYCKRGLCERAGLELDVLTRAWIGEPLGFERTRWVDRDARLPDGRPYTALLMNARDLARFGLAMAAGGRFGDCEVVADKEYLRDCLRPGSLANPAWGYGWWINGQAQYMQAMSDRVHAGAFAPDCPAELYGARGAMEQRLLVLPSRGLVIARLGERAPREAGNFDNAFVSRLLAER